VCDSPLSYSEFFYVLLFVVSSSEDSLLLSSVAVRCLTLSSSVLFYYASFAAWVSFFRQILFFRHFRFVDPTSLRGFYFMQFQTQGFVILHLEFEGDVRDIYWAMRPKPSVGPLIVIEANCSS
jgi:hypothetical protein